MQLRTCENKQAGRGDKIVTDNNSNKERIRKSNGSNNYLKGIIKGLECPVLATLFDYSKDANMNKRYPLLYDW